MIEWHLDLVAPWWIVPLYIGCLAAMALILIGFASLIERWLKR